MEEGWTMWELKPFLNGMTGWKDFLQDGDLCDKTLSTNSREEQSHLHL